MDLFEGESKGRFEISQRGDGGVVYREVVGERSKITFEHDRGLRIWVQSYEDGSVGFETNFPQMGSIYDKSGKLMSVMMSVEDMMRMYKRYRSIFSVRDADTVDQRIEKNEKIMVLINLRELSDIGFHIRSYDNGRDVGGCRLPTTGGYYDGPLPGMDARLRAYVGIWNACFSLNRLDGRVIIYHFKRFIDRETLNDILKGKKKVSEINMAEIVKLVSEDINLFKNNGKK